MSIELNKMPKLGFGLMRLPTKEGAVDLDRVAAMADAYIKAGLNYFDTAYVYHGGTSETTAREVIVKRYPRESFYLADKLPAWCIKSAEDRDRIFSEQLERTGAGYFDFYLLHSLEDGYNYEVYEKYDCFSWALQKKQEGRIKHFGFSFHGTPELLEQVLDKHPEVEFVQIQLNYLDWDNPVIQSGRLYDILHSRNIPIIIMEPVKGGTLADPAPDVAGLFKAAAPEASYASWALRYAASLEGVMTVLSGMSNEEQMQDNLGTFTDFKPLSAEESEVVEKVRSVMLSDGTIGCTACRYCCDGCPMGIPIPDIFKTENSVRVYKDTWRAANHYKAITAATGKASDCIGCGQCESVCPQHLGIIELMKGIAERFETE